MIKNALLSDCKTYRYWLSRRWDETKPLVMFIGLNPSRADATDDDPTIRRLISFAVNMGYGGFYIVNLFAYRTPYSKELKQVDKPIGSENFYWIQAIAMDVARVVFCWGAAQARLVEKRSEIESVKKLFPNAMCFKITKGGHPQHPLFLKSETSLIPFKIG